MHLNANQKIPEGPSGYLSVRLLYCQWQLIEKILSLCGSQKAVLTVTDNFTRSEKSVLTAGVTANLTAACQVSSTWTPSGVHGGVHGKSDWLEARNLSLRYDQY